MKLIFRLEGFFAKIMMDDKSLYERNKLHAKRSLRKLEWLYFSTGSDNEETLKNNEKAFKHLLLVPELLPDEPGRINLKTKLLGSQVDFPIGISPTAYHQVMHPEGELATAKAAFGVKTCYVQSMFSSFTVERISEEFPGLVRWLVVRSFREREILACVIRRAEKCGYTALAVTVDSRVVRRVPFKLPPHVKMVNLPLSPIGTPDKDRILHPVGVTWDEVEWMKSICSLPIVLKGILTAEDAKLAV